MIKVKDGYAKLIGTTYSGSAARLLLSNGGDKAVSDFAASSHTHSASDITSGTLSVSRGGTGSTSFTSGAALIGNGTGAVSTRSITSSATKDSTSLITSGGVYSALAGKMNASINNIELNPSGSLKSYGGFIDFHFHNSDGTPLNASGEVTSDGKTPDYTSRIIEDAAGTISVNGVKFKGNKVTASGGFVGNLTGVADSATNLSNKPSLLISGNTIAVKAGEKTSDYITVPYATSAYTVSSYEVASSSNTKRRIWIDWTNKDGKVAYSDDLTYQTDIKTLFAPYVYGKITVPGGSYSWYQVQQYNSSEANPSYYDATCAIVNINSYTGWQPWIRGVDEEKGSWTIGQYTTNLHIGYIPKSNTTNGLTYRWDFGKDGSTVFPGAIKFNKILIPTSSGGTTYGAGTSGQVLKSNGTTVYWASDSNSNTWRAIQVNGTQIAGTGTGTYAVNFKSGTGISVSGTAGSSSAANAITITNTGVRATTINGNYLRVNTNGKNADLTIPYATLAGKLQASSNTITTTANDTTAKWGALHNTVHFYSTTGQLTDQPSQYGLVVNFNNSGSEVHQLWLTQASGDAYHRGGNSGGWSGTWRKFLDSSNYTSYVNTTNFPGINKTGTVTSVTVTGSNGLSGTGTVTTLGTITLSNSGVRSTTINGNYLRVNTNGTNADLTIPYATSAGSASSANWLNTNDTLTYGASGLNYFNINGTSGNTKANNTPTSAWYHIIRMNHGNSGGYLADIAVPLNDVGGVWWRQIRNGSFYGWYKILDSNNYDDYVNTTNFPGLNKTGTVTSVKVGGTSYSPSSGVISLPAYPTDTNYYHTRVYSSGLKISTGTGVNDMYVPTGTTSSLGVVKQHTASDCTSYTSDEGATTPAAVKKAVGLFAVTKVSTGTGLTGGDITSTGTISINSTYQTYISNGNTAHGWGNHANAGYIKSTSILKGWSDTRSAATKPNDYNGAFKVIGIKSAGTTLGLTSTQAGSYATIIGWRGWSDSSGGYAWEIASTDKNRLYVRSGSTTSWDNGWKAIAYTSDIPTKTSQLTNDSGYITSYVDTAAGKTFKTLSSKSHSGWTNNATDDKIIPTMSFIAYWNGAYSSTGASNLAYCVKGAFGSVVTQNTGWWTGVPTLSGGYMEFGKAIDFHNSSSSTADYDVRLRCTNAKGVVVDLPSSAGTLALTSQIPDVSSFITATSLDGYVNAIETSGNGNAITSASKSGKKITFTKGTTFLTAHQTIYALTIKNSAGTTQLTYTPNSAAGSITLTKAMVGLGNVDNTADANKTVAVANKLGTATKGSATNPIYLSSGSPMACTYSLKATVNSGTTSKLAYYSGTNAVSAYTSTLGSSNRPIYLNAGVPTACTWGTGAGSSTTSSYLISATSTTAGLQYNTSVRLYNNAVYSSYGFYESSDERLKTILNPVKVNLDELAKLRKVYYLWKDDSSNDTQLGVIAQDVQKLYPELVSVNSDTGYLSLSYDKLSVVALAAVDELHKTLNEVKEENKRLRELVKQLETKLMN